MMSIATIGSVTSLAVLAAIYVLTRRAYIKRARQLDRQRNTPEKRDDTRDGS